MSAPSIPELFEAAARRGQPRGANHVWQVALARAALPEVVSAPRDPRRGRAAVASAAAVAVVAAGVGATAWERGRRDDRVAWTATGLYLLPAALPAGWTVVGRLETGRAGTDERLTDLVVFATDASPGATIAVNTTHVVDGSARGALFGLSGSTEAIVVAGRDAQLLPGAESGYPVDVIEVGLPGVEVRVAGRDVDRAALLAAASQVVAATEAGVPLSIEGFAPTYSGPDRSGLVVPLAGQVLVLADGEGRVATVTVVPGAPLEPDAITWLLEDATVSVDGGEQIVTGTLRGEARVTTARAGATVLVTSTSIGVADLVDVVGGLVPVDPAEWDAVPVADGTSRGGD